MWILGPLGIVVVPTIEALHAPQIWPLGTCRVWEASVLGVPSCDDSPSRALRAMPKKQALKFLGHLGGRASLHLS